MRRSRSVDGGGPSDAGPGVTCRLPGSPPAAAS